LQKNGISLSSEKFAGITRISIDNIFRLRFETARSLKLAVAEFFIIGERIAGITGQLQAAEWLSKPSTMKVVCC
jgi:hypothetical protein